MKQTKQSNQQSLEIGHLTSKVSWLKASTWTTRSSGNVKFMPKTSAKTSAKSPTSFKFIFKGRLADSIYVTKKKVVMKIRAKTITAFSASTRAKRMFSLIDIASSRGYLVRKSN